MANDLNLPTIADSQAAGQWQTSNDGDAALGNALADIYTVDFSGGNVTLTAAQFRSAMMFVPSGLSATRALTLPTVKRGLFFVSNTDASDSITVTKGSTTVSVAAGNIGAFYTDGTANGLVGAIVTAGLGGSGDVVGPASVTDGNPVVFDGTTGKLIKQRTFTQLTASLNAVVGDSGSGGTKGLVPAPGSGDAAAGKFLKADGSFAVPPGTAGGVGDGDKGDITVSSTGTVWTIDNDVVTYAKMQNVSATSRILGRKTAGSGDTEECTLSDVLDFIGSAAQGDILYRGSSAWTRLGAGTSGQVLKTLGAAANPAWGNPTESIIIAVGDETTAITTGTAKVTFRMPYAFTLSSVRASLTTASSSGIPTVDIKESGTTIFSTKLTIDASEKTSTTAATAAVLSDTSLADDAEMTINIDVAGTGATGLKVYLIGTRT